MILQGTVSSGGWNGLSYQSISLNKGMEDEMEYVNKESIIPDQMIGKEEMNGNIADEPCVESINSSQEEEGEDNGNNSFKCEAIFTCIYSISFFKFMMWLWLWLE